MSPVRRPGRQLAILVGLTLVMSLAFVVPVGAQGSSKSEGVTTADLGVPADAPTPAEGKITRVLTLSAIEAPGPCPAGAEAPCFDVLTLVANPGDVVVLHGYWPDPAATHNIHVTQGLEGSPRSAPPSSGLHTLAFTMPEEGGVRFICDAHANTMIADVVTPAEAAAAGGGHESIPTLGVHFLAYWVGVIAFAILFIVYGLTFFLFKYNETRATTDHWDRSEPAGESKRLAAVAPLLAVGLGIAGIAAIVFVAMSR